MSTIGTVPRTICMQMTIVQYEQNVQYMFRARGITTKWRTLTEGNDGRAGSYRAIEEVRGKAMENGEGVEVEKQREWEIQKGGRR